jgi:hypothetical protein
MGVLWFLYTFAVCVMIPRGQKTRGFREIERMDAGRGDVPACVFVCMCACVYEAIFRVVFSDDWE